MEQYRLWRYLSAPLFILLLSLPTYGNELVIGTTFSGEALSHLVAEWNKLPDALPLRTLNRTSNSLTRLLSGEQAKDIDLILSSSPMLFYNLQHKQKLAPLPERLNPPKQFVPAMLQHHVAAFSLSGYGILSNIPLLENAEADVPSDWEELASPNLHTLLIISSPSRSDTTHIMMEALLQKKGWQNGWALINRIMANVGTISSRSFGVVDKIQAGLGGAGITIDNYANLITGQPQTGSSLVFHYFPDFPVSPTFIAVTANSNNPQQAAAFIRFLLSDKGQAALYNGKMGKYPITPLPTDHPLYEKQRFLFDQPQIDYELLLKRQTVVKLFFEHQIIYRLAQIQENWQMLYQKEQQHGKILFELREILSAVPITPQQAADENYLENFNPTQELLNWQQFFISQQAAFIEALEKL